MLRRDSPAARWAAGVAGGLPPAPLAILKSVITAVLFAPEDGDSAEVRHWLDAADEQPADESAAA